MVSKGRVLYFPEISVCLGRFESCPLTLGKRKEGLPRVERKKISAAQLSSLKAEFNLRMLAVREV